MAALPQGATGAPTLGVSCCSVIVYNVYLWPIFKRRKWHLLTELPCPDCFTAIECVGAPAAPFTALAAALDALSKTNVDWQRAVRRIAKKSRSKKEHRLQRTGPARMTVSSAPADIAEYQIRATGRAGRQHTVKTKSVYGAAG